MDDPGNKEGPFLEAFEGMKNILIIATESYMNYARSLICSIHENVLDFTIYLYLINASEEAVNDIKLQTRNLPVEVREKNDWSLDTEKNKHAFKNEVMCWSANVRGEIIKELLTKDKLIGLMYIDADSIVRGNIDEAFQLHRRCHIMFHFRPKDRDIGNILSGVMFFKKTKVTLEFVEQFCEAIKREDILEWYSDQKGLNSTYEAFKGRSDISFFNLSKKYIDWGYHSESKIWAGKGRSKKKKEFIRLQKAYYHKFIELSNKE